MRIAEYESRLTEVFTETEKAHHEAFSATDGNDPEWPLWYADYLQEPMSDILQTRFLKSSLIYCLMDADFEYKARELDVQWQKFYSDHFIGHFAPTDTPTKDSLVLYHTPTCPFCNKVRQMIDQLDLEVELRNINEDTGDRDELVAVRDRATVPVLRITSPNGDERWMPESRDIISYLEKTYK
jgi:glutaredoxin